MIQVDFTREPIIETVITPREGCKLVVRSSKTTGQEEYFVDAVEIVSFGHSIFYRSLERPKMFFVPATDYEILEVREARMVLKNVGLERTIKIAGGREPQQQQQQAQRQQQQQRDHAEKNEKVQQTNEEQEVGEEGSEVAPAADKLDVRSEKKRDRRRQSRRRRGRDGEEQDENGNKIESPEGEVAASQNVAPPVITTLLPPPPTLISDTIARYKENALFKDAFYNKDEQKVQSSSHQEVEKVVETIEEKPHEEQPQVFTDTTSPEEEGLIYLQRKNSHSEDKLEEIDIEHKE